MQARGPRDHDTARLMLLEDRPLTTLLAEYRSMLASDDPLLRAVAARQIERLSRRGAAAVGDRNQTAAASGLFRRLVEGLVGPLHERGNGIYEGPCPWHGSRSGRCLVTLPDEARWWCRSCRRGGDVVAWVALTRGVSFAAARRRLGLPRIVTPPRPRTEAVRYAR